jgi:hypothetical protein
MSTPRYRRPGPNMTVSAAVLHDPDWLLILQARMWGHFYVVRLMNNYREDKGIVKYILQKPSLDMSYIASNTRKINCSFYHLNYSKYDLSLLRLRNEQISD